MGARGWIGVGLAVLGLALMIWAWLSLTGQRKRVAAMKQWPVARGRITASHVNVGGRAFYPTIEFKYEVAGKSRVGTRLRPGHVGASTMGSAERMLRAFPRGSDAAVLYNPADPGEAYLEAKVSKMWPIMIALGAAFMAAGLTMAAIAWLR